MRRAGALLLALLIAGPALAAESAVLIVDVATVTVSPQPGARADAPLQVVQVYGGYWLSEKAARERYAEAEQLRAENASLRKDAVSPLQLVALALLGGVAAGYAAAKLSR